MTMSFTFASGKNFNKCESRYRSAGNAKEARIGVGDRAAFSRCYFRHVDDRLAFA